MPPRKTTKPKFQPQTVSFSMKRQINLGNWNSVTLEGTIWYNIDETAAPGDVDAAIVDARDTIREHIKDEAMQLWTTVTRNRALNAKTIKDLEQAKIDPVLAAIYLREHVQFDDPTDMVELLQETIASFAETDADGNPIPPKDEPS